MHSFSTMQTLCSVTQPVRMVHMMASGMPWALGLFSALRWYLETWDLECPMEEL